MPFGEPEASVVPAVTTIGAGSVNVKVRDSKQPFASVIVKVY